MAYAGITATLDGLPYTGPQLLKLNLGCADRPMKGYVNVDLVPPCDQVADLDKLWPWQNNAIAEIQAWDIFEHLPSKIHTMNEAHRVLAPGGKLDLLVPTTAGFGAFQDPTHKSFWTPNDLFYYCENYGQGEWQRFHKSYGITARFRLMVNPEHRPLVHNVWKLRAILEAVK